MPLIRLDQLVPFQAVNVRSDPGDLGGPVVIPSCAQFQLWWGLTNGKIGHNVFYGRYAGAYHGTKAEVDAINAQIKTGGVWAALAAHLAPTTTLVSVSIRDVNEAEQVMTLSDGTPTPGTSAGVALPDEVSAVITLQTAKSGAQNRGRLYIPGWASSAMGAGGVMAAAAVTALGTWATDSLLQALEDQGYTPVIGQKARAAYTGTTGTQHPARPAGSEVITSATVKDNHWDTQRKRGLR